IEGYNGRLDALQAGILRVKLARLAGWNEKRRAHANRYRELLANNVAGVVAPMEPSSSKAIYHLFVIRTADRDRVKSGLADAGIGTGIHYPIPLHLQKAYDCLGYKAGDFPITEKVSEEILSLPMFPELTPEQQVEVVEKLAEQTVQLGAGST